MNPELYETSNAWGTAREKERVEGVGGREPEQLPEHVFAIQMAKNQPWRERLTVGSARVSFQYLLFNVFCFVGVFGGGGGRGGVLAPVLVSSFPWVCPPPPPARTFRYFLVRFVKRLLPCLAEKHMAERLAS